MIMPIVTTAARAIAYVVLHGTLLLARALLFIQRAALVALAGLLIILLGYAAIVELRPRPAPPEVPAMLSALRQAPVGTLQGEQVTQDGRGTTTYRLDYKTEQGSVEITNTLDHTLRRMGMAQAISIPLLNIPLDDMWSLQSCPAHHIRFINQGNALSIFYAVSECPAQAE